MHIVEKRSFRIIQLNGILLNSISAYAVHKAQQYVHNARINLKFLIRQMISQFLQIKADGVYDVKPL